MKLIDDDGRREGGGKKELNQRRFVVDALDDVDLSLIGPVRAHEPKGGPYRTTVRHVVKVGNDETVLECLHGRNTDTVIRKG
jgi:hypothetical protein